VLPLGAIFELKIHQNAYATGTPLGKLTEPPDPLAGFQEAASRQGGRKGEGRDGRRKREAVTSPTSFFTI